MLKTEVLRLVKKVAKKYAMEPAMFASFVETESGGVGFNVDGKIMIQFEPAWFKRKTSYAPSGLWSVNKIEKQSQEWIAFNDAFKINPNAAMESTSIGMGQIMGFHWKLLGFSSVGAMWDNAKASLENQIEQIALFILKSPALYRAIKNKDFHLIAVNYNGAGYLALAKRIKREPYNITLKNSYNKYLNYNWAQLN